MTDFASQGCTLLTEELKREDFECQGTAVQAFFREQAWTNHVCDWGRTYVMLASTEEQRSGLPRILGFYTICMGRLATTDLPAASLTKPSPNLIPTALLAQIGRDVRAPASLGIGELMIGNMMRRVIELAGMVGCAAIMLHADNEILVKHYKKYGFIETKRKLLMYIPISTVRQAAGPT